MSQTWANPDDTRMWSVAAGLALAVHIGVAVLVLAWSRTAEPLMPEPVVLVELPPEAAPAPAAATQQAVAQPQSQPVVDNPVTPPLDVPPVRAPLPREAITLPPPAPARPSAPAPAPAIANPVVTTPTGTDTGASVTPGNDPRAKRAEVDYFSMISAHLNRRKTYPTEAKKARQEGIVTVRFTVDRGGGVSNVSIRRSSGHEILDSATLALLQRVAPLPRMPAAMPRDSVTVSLPIDYSLRTN